MTTADPDTLSSEARRARLFTRINKMDAWFQVFGLAWITPILKAAAGDNPKAQMKEIWRLLAVPLVAIAAFLVLWGTLAPKVQTSLGAIPGPAAVWTEAVNLHQDAQAKAAKERAHYEKVEARNQRFIDRGQPERVKDIPFTGAPSYYQQIWTSIQTVFFGFLIASAVAIPLGILSGLSPVANSASTRWCRFSNPCLRWPGCRSSPWWFPPFTRQMTGCSPNPSWSPRSPSRSARCGRR